MLLKGRSVNQWKILHALRSPFDFESRGEDVWWEGHEREVDASDLFKSSKSGQ